MRRIVACACAASACLLAALYYPGAAQPRTDSLAVQIVFEGQGAARLHHTKVNGIGRANAFARVAWTLRWTVPTNPAEPWPKSATPMAISGTASESSPNISIPEDGGCSSAVVANNGAPEQINAPYNGIVGLPVPLLIGSAVQTCYTKPGGGTYWFGLVADRAHSAADMQKVWYAHVPYNTTDPKFSCVPVSGHWEQSVTSPDDGDVATLQISWSGRVLVEVNGHKDVSCAAPAVPAVTPTG